MPIQKIRKEQIRSVDATTIEGTLPVANGGTGATSLDDIVVGSNKLTISGGADTVIGGNVSIDVAPANIAIDDLDGSTPLSLAKGGTGTNSGNITSTGTLTFTSANNSSIELVPQGTGDVGLPSTYLSSGTQDDNSVMPKSYIDSLVQGIRWNEPVRVATAANLPNGGTYTHTNGQWNSTANAALVIDGITLQANDRVLVKDSATTATKSKIVLTCSSVPANGSNLQFNFQDVYYRINFSTSADSTSFTGAGTAGDRFIWNIKQDDGGESTSTIITSLKAAMDTESNVNATISSGNVLTLEQFTEGAHTNANDQTGDAGGAFAADSGVELGRTTGSGIYSVADAGSGSSTWQLQRVAVSDVSDIESRAVFVKEGTENADSGFVQTLDSLFDQNKSNQVYNQFTGLGQIVAGDGISKSGNTISIDLNTESSSVAGLEIDSNGIRIAASAAGAGLTGGNGSALSINYVKDQFEATASSTDIVNKPAFLDLELKAAGGAQAGDSFSFSVDADGSGGTRKHRIDFIAGTDVKSFIDITVDSMPANNDRIDFSVDPNGTGGAETFRINFTNSGGTDSTFSGTGPAQADIDISSGNDDTVNAVATKIGALLNDIETGTDWDAADVATAGKATLTATNANSGGNNFDFSSIALVGSGITVGTANYSAASATAFTGADNAQIVKIARIAVGTDTDRAAQLPRIQTLLTSLETGTDWEAATTSGNVVTLESTDATNANKDFSSVSHSNDTRMGSLADNFRSKAQVVPSQNFLEESQIQVYLNGLLQESGPQADYMVSGNLIRFNNALDSTNNEEDRVILAYFRN